MAKSKTNASLFVAKRYDSPGNNQHLDAKQGGQMGYSIRPSEYVSNTAYVRRNVIPILIEAPKGFTVMPNGLALTSTLKSLMELHSKNITGLNDTLSVEFAEDAFGGAGEMQETLTNVTRERSTVSHTFTEKYGKATSSFFYTWIRGLLMDPNTKVPLYTQTEAGANNAITHTQLPDFTGATMLYIEPDPTHCHVVAAYLVTNMMPKSSGERTSERDLTSGGDLVEVSIEFTGITQVGSAVTKLAQSILSSIGFAGYDALGDMAPSHDEVGKALSKETIKYGFKENVNADNIAAIQRDNAK